MEDFPKTLLMVTFSFQVCSICHPSFTSIQQYWDDSILVDKKFDFGPDVMVIEGMILETSNDNSIPLLLELESSKIESTDALFHLFIQIQDDFNLKVTSLVIRFYKF